MVGRHWRTKKCPAAAKLHAANLVREVLVRDDAGVAEVAHAVVRAVPEVQLREHTTVSALGVRGVLGLQRLHAHAPAQSRLTP